MLANQYPDVLRRWAGLILPLARKGFIKRTFPNIYELEEIGWGILPAPLIVWLISQYQFTG